MSGPRRGAPIRVLHVMSNLQLGGTERQAVALSSGLDRRRFDVQVACLHAQGAFLGELQRRGIPIDAYPIRGLYGPAAFAQRLRLAHRLRKHRVDVIHSHGFQANLFATPAARLARVPVIVGSVRDLGDPLSSRQRWAQKLALRLCDRVVVNAHAVARRCVAEGYQRRRLVVIPNGIDVTGFARPITPGWRDENGIAPDALVVAVISRLDHARGVDFRGIRHFLKAARLVAGRFPDARFLLVGDGTDRAALEAFARELGLGERATFTGFRRDVPEILAHSAVVVQPSLTPALSNSVLEAMAARVPVIATAVGGNPELVQDGLTGLLVPPGDPRAIARALEILLANPGLRERLGRAGRRRVVERFSLERLTGASERLYVALLASRRRLLSRSAFRADEAMHRPVGRG